MKQNTKTVVTPKVGVVKSKAKTVVGTDGIERDARTNKSDLFLLGAGRFFAESAYYETGNDSAQRYIKLIHKVTKSDPAWVAAFLKWLRTEGNVRTAAIVGAAEYVKAGGPNGRAVVNSVIVRGDEPAEMLAYWINTHGKRIPQPIKRGVRDAATRLYNERNFAKFDSSSSAVRMADVVELTHPAPTGAWQSGLFKYMIEQRHGRATFEGKSLTYLEGRSKCSTRNDYLRELKLGNPTITWENVSSAGKGKMTAEEWLACYDHMGYMAKLRNLRNLEDAGVSIKDMRAVGESLANPEAVAKSRQLPMRFLSAYKAVKNNVWAGYLEEALDASLANVPKVKGNWLVLIDASGSMDWGYSQTGELSYYDSASVFGVAFAKANKATVRTYSDRLSPALDTKGKNVLQLVKSLRDRSYWHQGGTSTARCLKQAFGEGKFDGVLLLTDEQYNVGTGPDVALPANVPLYTFNLAGYKGGHKIEPNRVTVGGLSDAAFGMIATIENAKAAWPWEA